MTRLSVKDAGGPQVCAFLDMIAVSEMGRNHNADGKTLLQVSDDGYNVLVGSTASHPTLFNDYSKHPGRFIFLPSLNIKSSAAGRYQFLYKTWQSLQKILGLTGFTPEEQDRGAIELIHGRHALPFIQQDSIEVAIALCSQEWASLPGAGYGQHEQTLDYLLDAYKSNLPKYQGQST